MDSHPTRSERSDALNPLDQFRGPSKRLKIHPLEVALLWAVAAHLVFLPWAIGGMRVWSQWISLVLSAICFVLALWPRSYTPEHTGTTNFRALPWPKLIRFPIFWIGLAMLALVTTQALNPAWEFQTDGKTWWMRAIAHVAWLPHSVSVPFAHWGPWRQLLVYSSAFLTVCAVWVGFTRRRTLQRLFLVLSVNGVALAVFGLAERITGTAKIYWVRESENAAFFSTFVYKNHAGAYLFLALAVTCGSAAWHHLRSVRRLEKSNPSGVFAFLATGIGVSILVSYARGATLVAMVYLCIVVAGFLIHQFRLPKEARQPIIVIALLIIFGYFLKTGMNALHSDLAWDRLRQAVSGNDLSVETRMTLDQASFDMLRDHWGLGTGSGSFEFLFPIYQQHYPSIWGTVMFRHAHNDILEIPIELGLPGLILILAGFAFWGITLVRNYAWQNPLSASVVLGLLFLLGMSWGDFMLQNPAILVTWCALWPAATLWARMEEQRARG